MVGFFVLLGGTAVSAAIQQLETTEIVLVQTSDDDGAVTAAITDLGGTIIMEYDYLDVIAAEIPLGSLDELSAL